MFVTSPYNQSIYCNFVFKDYNILSSRIMQKKKLWRSAINQVDRKGSNLNYCASVLYRNTFIG